MATASHALSTFASFAAGLLGFALLAGCGGSEPAPRVPEAPAPEAPPAPTMQVQGQLGSMDPRAFDAAFNATLGDLQQCHIQRLQRVRWLAGDVKFFLRVGEDGSAKYAFLEDSTLGDGDAESCMLQVLTRTTWPKPIGGEAEVRKSLGFDAPGDVRPPASWSSNDISPALVANNAKLQACRGRSEGAFKATAYVVAGPPEAAPAAASAKGGKRGKGPKAPKPKKRPDTKPAGHILTVGIAPPNREGLEAIECLVGALKQMPMPSPGSYAAKVTFSL